MPVLVLLLAFLSDLSVVVENVERRTTTRLMIWAKNAEAARLAATARRIYERVLEFQPDHGIARGRLGYVRRKGRWVADEAQQHEVRARKDADGKLTKQYSEALKMLEEEHLSEVVRVCGKYGTTAEKQDRLLPLLAVRPRRADIHKALGHARIGNDYVRPGLVDMVRKAPLRLQAWRTATAPAPGEAEFTDQIPGVPGLKFQRVMGCDIGSDVAQKEVVAIVGRTQATLELLFGQEVWKRSPIAFLKPASYTAMIHELHNEPEKRRLYGRYGDYLSPDFYAIRLHAAADAGDRYAHAAGHMTMNHKTGRTYPWLAEGFGYFMSFELFDRGNISFVSLTESSGKLKFTRPPPSAKTRAACAKWLSDQMVAGRTYPLRGVCARTLNNLDFCASMEAYSFVRFLLLYDPAAMRKLPGALKEQEGGAQVTRTDRALKAAFGKGIEELEPLWRAFVLEITAG